MALTKITSNAFATSAVDSDAVGSSSITTAKIADVNVTHAKLHTAMDLSSKTVTLPSGASLGSSTAGLFNVKGGSSTSPQVRFFDGGTARARVGVPTGQTYLSLSGSDTLTADMAIDASGRVGIKNTTMSSFNQVGGADLLVIGSGAGDQGMTIYTGNTGTGSILFADGTTTSNQYEGYVQYVHSDNRMLFGTNHDTRMTISQTGNVGIGTGDPNTKLHVNGNVILGGTTASSSAVAGVHILDKQYSYWDSTLSKYQAALRLETVWDATGGTRAIGDYGGGIAFNHLGGHSVTHDENVHAWLGLRVVSTPGHETSALVFATNNNTSDEDAGITERMVIMPDGKVGIGTDSPPNLLTVDSNAAATTSDSISVRNRGISATGHTAGLRFQYNSAVPSAIRTVNTNISSGAGRLGLFTSPDGTAGNLVERLTILPTGFVGIGNASTNPGNPLHVNHNGAPSGVVAKIQSNGNPWVQQIGASSSWQTGATAKGWELYNDNTTSYHVAVQSDGDVGIGTRDPADKMHIKNDSGTTVYKAEVNSNSIVGLGILKTGSTNQEWAIADGVTVNGKLEIYDVTDSRSVMTFDGSGNVGINTTSPQYKLHINKGSNTYNPSTGIVENVVALQDSYDAVGSHMLTYSNLDGNWVDGTSGANSAWGWLWNFQAQTRAGMVYDHRGAEKLQIFSSYGSISFITADAADTNAVPTDSNMNERMSIDPGGSIGMGVAPYSNTKLTIGGTTTSYNATLMFDNNTSGGAEFFMLATDNTWTVGADKFIMGHGAPSSSNVDLEIDGDGYIHTTRERLSVGANFNATTGKRGLRVGRTVINWFNYGAQSSDRYLHIKTNLVNQTGSNPQPTMSLFHIRGYTYSAENIDSMLGFHNWSGSYYNTAYTNNGHRTVVSSSWAPYRSTDNKVVIVLDLGSNTYAGISIDYMQNYEYTWRDVEVSAYTRSANTSGVY